MIIEFNKGDHSTYINKNKIVYVEQTDINCWMIKLINRTFIQYEKIEDMAHVLSGFIFIVKKNKRELWINQDHIIEIQKCSKKDISNYTIVFYGGAFVTLEDDSILEKVRSYA